MTIEMFLCAYLLLINLLTFILFGLDKAKASTHSWRIPEKTLLLLSFAAGFPGGWLAMLLFRHKIKDFSFLPYMILITLSWLIGIIVFLRLNS
jgi:uncharacterized membrane protein YsdA (DUF1294 family)